MVLNVAAFRYSIKPEPETEWSKTGSINLLVIELMIGWMDENYKPAEMT